MNQQPLPHLYVPVHLGIYGAYTQGLERNQEASPWFSGAVLFRTKAMRWIS